jgi:tetratricopeptide (TPR) repeat protein
MMDTSPRRRVLPWVPAVTALAILVAAVPLPAQDDPRASMWLAAAQSHQPGALDGPVRMVSQWTSKHGVTTVARALRGRPPTDVLVKALVLHTDAAIAERNAVDAGHRQGRPGSAVILDGASFGSAPRSLHWQLGRLIADHLATRAVGLGPDGVTPDPAISDGVPAARTWYRASSALLQQWVDCGVLERHLDEGVRVFPTDATLLLYRATLHQALADARVQVWVKDAASTPSRRLAYPVYSRPRDNEDNLPPPTPEPMGMVENDRVAPIGIRSATEELGLAERDLRRAIALEPGLVEARIRLAHVLTAKGEPQEAAALARAALDQPLPPFFEFYAALMLGRAEEAAGRRAEARAAFERAAARFPKAQSARVALSRLALVERRPAAESVAALVALNTADAQRDGSDPWWWYFRTHDPEWKAQIAALRTLAR